MRPEEQRREPAALKESIKLDWIEPIFMIISIFGGDVKSR
jgi:hypothetical protein